MQKNLCEHKWKLGGYNLFKSTNKYFTNRTSIQGNSTMTRYRSSFFHFPLLWWIKQHFLIYLMSYWNSIIASARWSFSFDFFRTSRKKIVVIILDRSNCIDKHHPPPLCNTRYEMHFQKTFVDNFCYSQHFFLKSTCNSHVNKEMHLPTLLFEASAFDFKLFATLYKGSLSMKILNWHLDFFDNSVTADQICSF